MATAHSIACLAAAALGGGCSYLQDRLRDAADIATPSVGYGVGIEPARLVHRPVDQPDDGGQTSPSSARSERR